MEGRAEHVGIGVPRALVANAAEPARRGFGQRIEHRACGVAIGQVRMADDRRAGPRRAIKPARPPRRDAVDILDLADRLQRLAVSRVVERPALHEHGGDDVVAAGEIGLQLVERIERAFRQRVEERMPRFGKGAHQRAQIPQMMVRIDDRQLGFEDRFGHALRP